MRRPLGKTGLQISPLGIGGGGGIESKDVLYAFDHGINYFFFSSDLHHFIYQRSSEALRTLCGRRSAIRDKIVLSTVSYVNNPDKLESILFDQLNELRVDYIDVFHWGWITDTEGLPSLIQGTNAIKDNGVITKMYRRRQAMQEKVEKINEDMLRRGLVRYIGASFHSLRAVRTCMSSLDVLMLRYNLSHTGVEREIFPLISGNKEVDPGIVAFNTSHDHGYPFHVAPQGFPSDMVIPSVPDCYRFALSNPSVDTVLTGLSDRNQIDLALAALAQGPYNEQELAALRNYGSTHAEITGDLLLQSQLR